MQIGPGDQSDSYEQAKRIALRHIAAKTPGGGALGKYRTLPNRGTYFNVISGGIRQTGANFGQVSGQKVDAGKILRKGTRQEGIEQRLPGVGNAVGALERTVARKQRPAASLRTSGKPKPSQPSYGMS